MIGRLDRDALDAVASLRWAPLTPVMVLLSAWWVKSLALGAVGALADLVRRPRRWPPTLVPVALAAGLAALLSTVLKQLVARPRPGPAAHPLVATPGDPSMPSGHALVAFAVAGVVGAMHPRLRIPAFVVAALIAFSRVYLGVHYPLDVLAGATLGLLVAWVVMTVAGAAGRLRQPPPRAARSGAGR